MSEVPAENNSICKTIPNQNENKLDSVVFKGLSSFELYENYNSNNNNEKNEKNENNVNNKNNEENEKKSIFQNIEGQNIEGQNMGGQNMGGQNMEGQNIEGQNVVSFESKQQSVKENEHENEDENENENENNVYDSVVFSSRKINIYQYKHCPHKFFSSLLRVLKEELIEPYCIFMLQDLLNTYGDVSLIATIEENDKEYMTVGVIVNKIHIRYETNRTNFSYEGHICMLAVHSAFQGMGIGSYLLEESIKLMQKYHRVVSVSLDAAAFNTKALRFYERHEFIRTKRNLRYYVLGADSFELIRFV